AKIVPSQFARRARETIGPQKIELLRLQIEDRAAVVRLGRGKIQRVAQAQAEREALGCLPIVLNKEFGDLRSRLQCLPLNIDIEGRHLAGQKRGEAVAGVGDRRSGRAEAACEDASERKEPAGVRRLQDIQTLQPDVRAELQAVARAKLRIGIDELRNR